MTSPKSPKPAEAGPTAAASVADELVRMIVGEMAPGASMPSEAEMAIKHGVSRVTVREAVKMLAGRGLLELARGRRAVVSEPDSSSLGEFMSWIVKHDPKGVFDLIEIRQSLEVLSAGLAARRAARLSINAVEANLAGMREVASGGKAGSGGADEVAFHRFDVGFHEQLAVASGNRILVSLFEAMGPALERSFFLARRGRHLRGQSSERVIAMHQLVLDKVLAGDVAGAEAAMRSHLGEAARDMQAAFGG
jgi:DNA-binding FadR family transcriptional regulator